MKQINARKYKIQHNRAPKLRIIANNMKLERTKRNNELLKKKKKKNIECLRNVSKLTCAAVSELDSLKR